MNIRKSLVTGVFWSFVKNGGQQGISLLVFLVLARLLAPEAFGLIAMAKAFIGLVDQFSDLGFSSAIVQKKEIKNDHLSSAFWFNFISSLCIAAFFYLASTWIASLYNEPELVVITRILSLTIIIGGLKRVQFAILKKQLRFKQLALIGLFSGTVAGGVGVTMAFMGFGVSSLIAYQLLLSLSQLVLFWAFTSWKPKLLFSLERFKELWGFGLNVTSWRFFTNASRRGFDYLVGLYFGAAGLGYFTIAFKIVDSLNTVFTKTIWKVLFPVFSAIQDDLKLLRKYYLQINHYIAAFTIPGYLWIGINSELIIKWFFGEQWLPSSLLLSVIVFSGMAKALAGVARQFLMSTGNTKVVSFTSFLTFALIVTSIIFLRNYTLLFVALAYTSITVFIMAVIILKTTYKLHSNVAEILTSFRYSIISVAIMTSSYWLTNTIWKDEITVAVFTIVALTVTTSYLLWKGLKARALFAKK